MTANAIRSPAPDPGDYRAFLQAKVRLAKRSGFDVPEADLQHRWIKPHVGAAVRWMLAGGRRAVFASFGLHKTTMQLVAADRCLRHLRDGEGDQAAPVHRALIVAPLGVRREFMRDAGELGITVRFVRSVVECWGPGIYLTNYETAREGKLPAELFSFVSLDEAAVLRGMGGTKAFRAFMNDGWEHVPYRFVATATPSPNDYIELLAYAAFLGVMDVGEAKTRFFRRDSEHADKLTLHPHKEAEFWLWVASWALFITKPSDLGFPDEGYELPPLAVRWHEVQVDHGSARAEKSGQGVLFRNASLGVVEAAAEKRNTLVARIAKTAELLAEHPTEHAIVWHDLEDERRMLEDACPDMATVFGSQALEDREEIVAAFADGYLARIGAKPSMLGAGTNLQRHCRWAIFASVSSKFHDFIQAVHRLLRFGQGREVWIDIVHSESQREEVENLRRKWRQHVTMVAKMTAIIRQYGLSDAAMAQALQRSLLEPDERMEVSEACPGQPRYVLARNDCVYECRRMAEGSVQLIVSSIPFGTQYEYSPSYNDLGHTDDAAHFWRHMDYLVPELLRILEPGRVAAIHVKDRIVPGGLTGLGFQTVYPFADDCRAAFRKAGFAYLGEKTNLTDVVRENNQTYRLGWSEQLKDGSRMGCGLPEKVLLFRKPPSDSSNGYADRPVAKARPDFVDRDGAPAEYSTKRNDIRPVPGTGYSRARWQIDAHHYMRTSGDRPIAPEEWAAFDARRVYRLWKAFSLTQLYDFEHHVKIGEALDAVGKLPPDFMLLPPHSWHPDVWTDVAQMLSANTLQCQQGLEQHLCPMPFDIADRLIVQFSEPGDMVFDPFMGLGTTPMRALRLGRRGGGSELNPGYFLDAVKHVEAAAREMATPSLFDLLGERGPVTDEEVAA